MQVTETKSEGLAREYTVVVDAKSIEGKLNERLLGLSRQAQMRGFRPGKVPVGLLKKLHGKNLMGEVLEETVSETSQRVLSEADLRAAFRPDIEILKFEEGSDLKFAMSLEVLPKFEVGVLSDLSLERLTAPVGDAEVEAFLENLADQQKSFKPAPSKSHRAARGDTARIDFVGRVDGEEFDGGKGSDMDLELGSNRFIPGFEDQLQGVKAGDRVVVNVTFPEDYGVKDLAGKAAVFDVDVKELRVPETPSIDDQLAVKLGLEDLAALKKLAREQIERDHARLSRLRIKRHLLDVLADQYAFDVPKRMLEVEFDMIWRQLTQDLEQHGEDLASLDKPEAEAREEYRGIAERRVRLGLLLSEIGRRNNIDVRQDEINRMITEEARRYPGQEKQIFEYYKNNPDAVAQMRAPLLEEKVVDFVLEMAQITEREVSIEELTRDPDETPVKAKSKDKSTAKSKAKPKAKAKPKTKAKSKSGPKADKE